MIPFCPDIKTWRTENDEVVTVADLLETSDWNGLYLHITGSQKDDYSGASSLFNVVMDKNLAMKHFGQCRVFSADFHNVGEINVADKNHLFSWARQRGIKNLDEMRAKYVEYRLLFPSNCLREISRMRIETYTEELHIVLR